VLARLQAACVVVSKQQRDKTIQPPKVPHKLRRLANSTCAPTASRSATSPHWSS
jgi:hypothetical protein